MEALLTVVVLVLWWVFFSTPRSRSERREFRRTHVHDYATGLWMEKP